MKLKGSLKRLFLVVLAISAVFFTPVGSASATISDAFKKWYALNGIIFPDNCVEAAYTTSASGTVGTVSENSNAAKIWNYFVTANIPGVSDNAAVIAGIMGNFQQETNFNPFSANDTYYGLFQANKDYDPDLLKNIEAAGLSQYWRSESAPEDAVIKAITIELDYLTKQDARFGKDTGYGFLANLSKITNKTPEAYSDLFEVSVEGAVTADKISPYTGSSNYIEDPVARSIGVQYFSGNPGGGEYYQEAGDRRKFAREIFERYSTAAAATTISAASNTVVSSGSIDYSAVLTAKNADKYFYNGSGDVPSAEWDDYDDESKKRLLETYGDLAYQLGRAVNAPYIAILVQMRYEDPTSACGANNFWGNGCFPGTGTGGASIQAANLGEGFMQYGQTLTNGYHDQAIGISDPTEYLQKLAPTWIGVSDSYTSGFENSVAELTKYINSAEGQAIVKTFGNYHASGTVNTTSYTWTDGWVSGIPGLTKTDSLDAGLSEMPASSYTTADGKPNKILLHYTQGLGNGINAFPPNNRFPSHFIVDLTKKEGFQLLTADRPSVATISGDTTSIQIEIVGYGYQSEIDADHPVGSSSREEAMRHLLTSFSDADWDYLAVLLGAISSHYNIPLTTPVSWDVSGDGDQSKRVASQAEFDAMTGVVGHMHPPFDDHTDPGNIWPMVEAAIARNPSGQNQGISSVNRCGNAASTNPGSSSNGVTTTTYNGHTIAFPIAGATKDMQSQVSDLPCNHPVGCHYGPGNPAGQAAAAFDLCMGDNCDNQTVVSMTSGTVTQLTDTRNGVSCNHVRIRSEIDNTVIAYMHLTGEPYTFKEGDHVNAGDIIGHISPGVSPCNDNSMAHVHIDKGKDTSAVGGPMQDDRDSEIVPMMNAAWEALPANQAELLTRQGQTTLSSGGLTEAQASAIASYYKSSSVPSDNSTWRMPSNNTKWNCFSFSAWWFQILTSVGYTDSVLTWGEGAKDIAHSISQQFSLQTGTTPRVYSIFSVTSGVTYCSDGNLCGHTGVVVAVNGNDVTTIEAAYGADGYTEVVHRDLSYFVNTAHPSETFVYLDTVMDQSKLNNLLTQLGV